MSTPTVTVPLSSECLMRAWDTYAHELRRWLRNHAPEEENIDDLLQELFLKSLRHRQSFCEIEDARAWLFRATRNLVTDKLRTRRKYTRLPDDVSGELTEPAPVDLLAVCLPRTLSELDFQDREIIQTCDIEGMRQADYAQAHALSLAAVKSRLLRARKRLKERLNQACQIRYDETTAQLCCFVQRDTETPPG